MQRNMKGVVNKRIANRSKNREILWFGIKWAVTYWRRNVAGQ